MRAFVWLALGCAVAPACTCGPELGAPRIETREEPQSAHAASEYMPLQPGNRWAYEGSAGPSTMAVIAVQEGVAIVVGSARTAPLRLRTTPVAVTMLDLEGRELGALLDGPIEEERSWHYELGDTRCEARYVDIDVSTEVAGLTLEACVRVERRCVHPAGQPFPIETTEVHEELYCPAVGRVEERIALEPAPEGMPLAREDRLTFYRVAGAPVPQRDASRACEQFLLLESDVQAACGTGFHRAEASDDAPDCTFEFTGGGESRVQVSLLGPAGDDHVAPDWLSEHPSIESTSNGQRFRAVLYGDACPLERFGQLEPLIESLLSD